MKALEIQSQLSSWLSLLDNCRQQLRRRAVLQNPNKIYAVLDICRRIMVIEGGTQHYI
jgi:hypothetical protein